MEYYLWFAVIGSVIFFSSYPSKIKKLESKIKKLERNMKGENYMSKLLSELINKKCILICGEDILIDNRMEVECTILDVDDEWIKFTFTDKKGLNKTQMSRVEAIESVQIIGD